ncbi:helix-turn-helix transcriptional regulator [Flaviflexus equikiangi]|uniref:Helix-turn-helix transcriptional regulator n=1 Tax=Flaviflexus equikiangi TaxID=2758573 RepID=A0ABS2TCL9_9ACTO|nr:helix-turn-helix transcriptional regulator [Flaviflexus equikiangi]MBM9432372.1 helix-turn-helix transcriptional regulator [Flaviflexus equikiangi]
MTRNHWSFTVKLISKETLRQFLKFRDMSYGQLAKRVGCSKSLIGLLATGRRTGTSVDIAKAICRELDVPVESLFLPVLSSGSCTANREAVSA